MENKILINDIVTRCLRYLEDNCYTRSRIDRYKWYWHHGILPFLKNHKEEHLTDALAAEYLESCVKDGTVRHQDREMMRSVKILVELWHTGKISRLYYKAVNLELTGPIGKAMENFIAHMCDLRRSESTISSYRRNLHDFLRYLEDNGVNELGEIAEWHVMKFIAAQETGKVGKISILRMLFKHWKETGVIDYDLEESFAGYAPKKHERIPSFYSQEEVVQIEKSVDRGSAVGKRNYAMLLLADRLGLRASDIARLEFGNIDWDRNEIHLVQHKTSVPLDLPLLADVGNAIIDYLQYGRPKSNINYVFLSARAPFRKISRISVGTAIAKIILSSGVDVTCRHHGPHAMRHSLASTLLDNGTSIPVISETLGHKSSETTMTYLKIDLTSLQKCALPVPPVPDDFYLQKGGVFYE